jgi:predicted alpha/beta hydrolase family esterase
MPHCASRDLLLLDGWQHRREPGHWQGWLAQAATDAGWTVVEPTLPTPENPDLAVWRAAVLGWLERYPGCTVVAHGLTALLWLHLAAAGLGTVPPASRVLLVAPPAPGRHGGDVSAAPVLDPRGVRAASGEVPLLVFAPDDPWAQPPAGTLYGPLELPTVEVPGGAHLNGAAGLGPWPAALHWLDEGSWPTPEGSALQAMTVAHRPGGRRLGIAVAGDLPNGVLDHAARLLRITGQRPLRRLATVRPRVGETRTRPEDVSDFVRRYGHEYTLLTVPEDLRSSSLEDACRDEGCLLVTTPSSTEMGPS